VRASARICAPPCPLFVPSLSDRREMGGMKLLVCVLGRANRCAPISFAGVQFIVSNYVGVQRGNRPFLASLTAMGLPLRSVSGVKPKEPGFREWSEGERSLLPEQVDLLLLTPPPARFSMALAARTSFLVIMVPGVGL